METTGINRTYSPAGKTGRNNVDNEISDILPEVMLKVYDIRSKQVIYHHRIIGKVSTDENISEYSFAKSANGLVICAVNQALKKK